MTTDDIHSCSPFCPRPACVESRERERFEAHMRDVAPARELGRRIDGSYWDADTEHDWLIWQAATAATARECAEACEAADNAAIDCGLSGEYGAECAQAIRERFGL